jgi:hypothetical protein
MAFRAFRAMGQPSTDGKRFDFQTVAFSPHDKHLLGLEMQCTKL